jgi:hypothetical protein
MWQDMKISEDTAVWVWRWKQQDPPKRWYPTTSLYGVITQKTVTSISITVKTSKTCFNTWSQELATGLFPKPVEFGPHPQIPYQNFYVFPVSLMRATCYVRLMCLGLITFTTFCKLFKLWSFWLRKRLLYVSVNIHMCTAFFAKEK